MRLLPISINELRLFVRIELTSRLYGLRLKNCDDDYTEIEKEFIQFFNIGRLE